jgi:hypothetical protein
MAETSYFLQGFLRQGNASLARAYLGISQSPLGPTSFVFSAQNNGTNFWVGAALARHPSGSGLILADATSIARKAVGLATIGAAVGFSETAQLDGLFQMNDWTQVVGSPTLQALSDYYLSATPGRLSAVAPNVPGQIAQAVGFSLSSTTLMVNPQKAFLL